MIVGVTLWEIVWTGGLPHVRGLPHLPGVPHLHVNRPLGNQKIKLIILYIALVKLALPESALQYLSFDQKQFHL